MKIFLIITTLLSLSLNACAPKGPTTFEKGIFQRDVAQVSLNTKKIAKNTKECELVLDEIKEVQTRVGTPEHKEESPASSEEPKAN